MENCRFHHIGIAVNDIHNALKTYELLFGYKLDSGPFDDPLQNVSVCFISRGSGDPSIELVAPLGPNSPIDRILKKGGGTYHLCYEVTDIHQTMERLQSQGLFLLSGPTPAVAFNERSIAWLLSDEANLLVELVEQER